MHTCFFIKKSEFYFNCFSPLSIIIWSIYSEGCFLLWVKYYIIQSVASWGTNDVLGFLLSFPKVLLNQMFYSAPCSRKEAQLYSSFSLPPQPQLGTRTTGVERQIHWLWSNTRHLLKLMKECLVQIASFIFLPKCRAHPDLGWAWRKPEKGLNSSMFQIHQAHTPCLTGLSASPGPGGKWCWSGYPYNSLETEVHRELTPDGVIQWAPGSCGKLQCQAPQPVAPTPWSLTLWVGWELDLQGKKGDLYISSIKPKRNTSSFKNWNAFVITRPFH